MVVSSESLVATGLYEAPHSWAMRPCPRLDLGFGSVRTLSPAPGGVMVLGQWEDIWPRDARQGACCVPAMGRSRRSEMKLTSAENKSRVEGES